MEYGYICFAYTKNEWVPKEISAITHSKWSHSFITAPLMLGREMAMEAAAGGVSLVPFDIAYRNNPNQKYEVYKFKCDPDKIDASISKCMNELEMGYGYLQFPWFIWRAINESVGKDIKSQDNWSQKGIVCSGFARHFIEYAGYSELFAGFGKNSANAQDVYRIVLARPKLFELIEKKD